MTVAELIALLQAQPGDMEAVVQSYEEGFDPVTDVQVISLAKNTKKTWFVGIYEESDGGKPALLIKSRYNREEKSEAENYGE